MFVSVSAPDTIPKDLIGTTIVRVGALVGARVFAEVGGGAGARVLTEVGGRVGARSLQMSAEESAKLCSSSVSACCSYPSTSTLSLSLVSLFLISFPQMTCSSSTSFRGIEDHVDCVCFLGWLLPMDSSSIQFPLEVEQFASSRNGNVQNAIMAQYARDVLNSRNLYYRGYRK